MVFSSYTFLMIFLPIVLVGYYISKFMPRSAGNLFLLLASLVFYGWNNPKYLILLFVSIFINWLGGLLVSLVTKVWIRKFVLFVTVFLNCALLGIFKYTDFIIANMNRVLSTDLQLLNIALPIGISFYTFQGLSYAVDVYCGRGRVQKNPLNVALYISLFPQLVAGPIVRYDSIAEQLMDRTESVEKVIAGFRRFAVGLAKKMIIADTFGSVADVVFGADALTSGMAWIGALAYTIQIYFDFSGYSDMAIGLGKMFGFEFSENFNYPYISTSVTEFWRRWHISLSTWFRDYVYIPLGGNRTSTGRHIFNMFVVWALTGLWHGAAWNYVIWGIYYFVWLCLEKYVLKDILEKIPRVIRWVTTMLIVMVGWVIFRAESLGAALDYIKVMFRFDLSVNSTDDFMRYLLNYKFFWLIALVCAMPIVPQLNKIIEEKMSDSFVISSVKNVIMILLIVLCSIFVVASSYNAFIYFQF